MRHRRRPYWLAAALVAATAAGTVVTRGAGTTSVAPLPFATGERAAMADSFVDSVGVNTHLHYGASPYSDADAVRHALGDLGVRHIRDYPVPGSLKRLRELGEDGIRLTAIMGTARPRRWMPYGLEDLHEVVRDLSPMVAAVEGVNEWDITDDSRWSTSVRDHQRALWEAVKNDRRTSRLPVLAPSITWARNMDEAGDLSEWADFGNIHPYPGGRTPDQRVLDDIRSSQQLNVDGKPVVATETGYHNFLASGQRHAGVPEDVAGVYLPRLFLTYFAVGVVRTFAYELVDQGDGTSGRESSFGLLRADFTAKPAYHNLRHLLDLLADPGPPFHPGRLDLDLTGQGTRTEHVLLQKRDGTFFLVLWLPDAVWDVPTRRRIAVASERVRVRLAQPIAAARCWTLGSHQPPSVVTSPEELEIEVTAAVRVVELTPRQVTRSSPAHPRPSPGRPSGSPSSSVCRSPSCPQKPC